MSRGGNGYLDLLEELGVEDLALPQEDHGQQAAGHAQLPEDQYDFQKYDLSEYLSAAEEGVASASESTPPSLPQLPTFPIAGTVQCATEKVQGNRGYSQDLQSGSTAHQPESRQLGPDQLAGWRFDEIAPEDQAAVATAKRGEGTEGLAGDSTVSVLGNLFNKHGGFIKGVNKTQKNRKAVRTEMARKCNEWSEDYDKSLDDTSKESILQKSLKAIDEYIGGVISANFYKNNGSLRKNADPKNLIECLDKKQFAKTALGTAMLGKVQSGWKFRNVVTISDVDPHHDEKEEINREINKKRSAIASSLNQMKKSWDIGCSFVKMHPALISVKHFFDSMRGEYLKLVALKASIGGDGEVKERYKNLTSFLNGFQNDEFKDTLFGKAMLDYLATNPDLGDEVEEVSHAAQPAAAAASPSHPDLSNVTAMEGPYPESHPAASSAYYYQPPQGGSRGKRAASDSLSPLFSHPPIYGSTVATAASSDPPQLQELQRQPELPDPLGDFFEGSWLTDAPLGHAPQVSIDYPVAVNSHHQAVSRPSGGGVPTIAGTAQGAARLVPRGDDYLQWSSVASQAGPRHVLDIKRSASGDSYDHLRDLIKEGRLNEARTEVRRSLRKSIKEQSQNYDESLDDSSKEGALKESLEAIDEYIAIVKKLDLYKQKGSNDKNTEPKTLFLDIQKKESSITDFGGAMIAYINARENLERRRPGIVSHAAQPAAAAAASPSYPDLSNVTAMEGSYSEAYLAASSAYYQPPQRGASGKRARMGDGNPQQDYCSQSQGLDYSLPHIPDSPIVPSSTYGPDPAGAYFSTFNERASAASPTVSPGLEMEGQQENPGDLDFLEQLLFQQIDKGSQGSR